MGKLSDEKYPAHFIVQVDQAQIAAFGAGVLQAMDENAHTSRTHILEAGKIDYYANLVLVAELVDFFPQLIGIFEGYFALNGDNYDTVFMLLAFNG